MFKSSVTDLDRQGWPSTSTNEQFMEHAEIMILRNCRVIIEETTTELSKPVM